MFFQNVYRGRNEFWQYLLTFFGVFMAYLIGQLPLLFVALGNAPDMQEGMNRLNQFAVDYKMESLGIDLNLGLFLILLTFVAGMIALWFFITYLHKRPFISLITTYDRINWSKIFFGFWLWIGLTLIFEGIGYLMNPDAFSLQFDLAKFLPLLLIALLILPIQTTFEEVFFRGYLMQGLGSVNSNRLIPLLITSVLFGSMHFANPEVQEFGAGLMMTYYIGVGLFLGIITLLDDSLELAIGVHAATNIFASVFVTFESSALQTNAIFRTSEFNIELSLISTLVMVLIFLFICRRKYDWAGWYKVLGTIDKPPSKVVLKDHSDDDILD